MTEVAKDKHRTNIPRKNALELVLTRILEKPQKHRTPENWYGVYVSSYPHKGQTPPLDKDAFIKTYMQLDEIGKGIIEADLILGPEETEKRNREWGVKATLHDKVSEEQVTGDGAAVDNEKAKKNGLELYVEEIKAASGSIPITQKSMLSIF